MNDVQKEVEAILQEAGNGFVDSFNEDKLRELITAALNRRSPALSAIEADRNKRAGAGEVANGKLMAAREKVAKANAIGHHLGARLLIEGSDEALNAIDALLASPAPDTSTPSTHPQDTSKSAGEIDTTYGEKLLVAAKEVLSWIEIKHRPPVRDEIEHGRMVYVRLHALADLHEAVIAAQGRKS